MKSLKILAILLTGSSALAQDSSVEMEMPLILNRIHFGSCIKQAEPTPIFETIIRDQPEIFVMTGDNIYADTHDMAEMKAKYEELGGNPLFQELRETCPILATWDDHDYGMNDAGSEYPEKKESQAQFLDFWKVRPGSPRRSREGIYDSVIIGPRGTDVQIILLDTRYFRGALKAGEKRMGGKYYPEPDASVPMLGEAQWKWLEEELRKPAALRVIVSSIQFVASASGQETWSNLPEERKWMINLIKDTGAKGVLFISGDRHWSEISMQEKLVPYPIFDITSSGLNQIHPRGTPTGNEYRISETTYHQPNYGVIGIDWEIGTVSLQIHDINGETVIEEVVGLVELQSHQGK